jgi:ureidoacrylate peracid hydrolase
MASADARLEIDPRRTALVLFDLLNAFVNSDDPVRRESAHAALGPCRRALDAARGGGMRVFYANSVHRPDGTDYAPTITDASTELAPWPDGPRLMGMPPGIEGTSGAEIVAELEPAAADYVVPKHRWSAFAGTSLDILLRGLGIDTILLAGGSTDIGILSTACWARDLGYHLVVLRDACQTHRPDAQEFCMTRLFPRMARVMTVDEVLDLFVERV